MKPITMNDSWFARLLNKYFNKYIDLKVTKHAKGDTIQRTFTSKRYIEIHRANETGDGYHSDDDNDTTAVIIFGKEYEGHSIEEIEEIDSNFPQYNSIDLRKYPGWKIAEVGFFFPASEYRGNLSIREMYRANGEWDYNVIDSNIELIESRWYYVPTASLQNPSLTTTTFVPILSSKEKGTLKPVKTKVILEKTFSEPGYEHLQYKNQWGTKDRRII